MPTNWRRAVLIIASANAGGGTASNIASGDWYIAGLFATLTVIGLMSFWWTLIYDDNRNDPKYEGFVQGIEFVVMQLGLPIKIQH